MSDTPWTRSDGKPGGAGGTNLQPGTWTLLGTDIRVQRRQHNNWIDPRDHPDLPVCVGRWHYIYRRGAHKISLVHITMQLGPWEACSINGGLVRTPQRFGSRKQAEDHIREILMGSEDA